MYAILFDSSSSGFITDATKLTLLLFGRPTNDVDLIGLEAERRVDGDVFATAVRAVDDDVVVLQADIYCS